MYLVFLDLDRYVPEIVDTARLLGNTRKGYASASARIRQAAFIAKSVVCHLEPLSCPQSFGASISRNERNHLLF